MGSLVHQSQLFEAENKIIKCEKSLNDLSLIVEKLQKKNTSVKEFLEKAIDIL